MKQLNQERIYQRIGEFVMGFQWIENLLEQILWTLRDPHWRGDLRVHTADVHFRTLVDQAAAEFDTNLRRVTPSDAGGWGQRFPELAPG
jgi:hypothetical protein